MAITSNSIHLIDAAPDYDDLYVGFVKLLAPVSQYTIPYLESLPPSITSDSIHPIDATPDYDDLYVGFVKLLAPVSQYTVPYLETQAEFVINWGQDITWAQDIIWPFGSPVVRDAVGFFGFNF